MAVLAPERTVGRVPPNGRAVARTVRDRLRAGYWNARLLTEDRGPWRERPVVFVVGEPRAGTTLLHGYFERRRGWAMGGEILNPERPTPPVARSPAGARRLLDHALLGLDGDVVGGKLMIGHLRHWHLRPEELCRRYPSAKFLIIHRSSFLDQYVSLLVARHTNVWNRRATGTTEAKTEASTDDHDGAAFRVSGSEAELRRFCAIHREHYRSIAGPFAGRSAWICFEDLHADAAGHLRDRASTLLDDPFDRVDAPPTRRLPRRSPSDTLEDFPTVVPDPHAPWLHFDPVSEFGLDPRTGRT